MPYKDPEVNKEYHRRYQQEHADKHSLWQYRSKHKLKRKVLAHYGKGMCACVICGESRLACLSIDHIDGKGAEHRRRMGYHLGCHFYRWLRRQDYPEGYQTLCMNCQWVKRDENREFTNGRNR